MKPIRKESDIFHSILDSANELSWEERSVLIHTHLIHQVRPEKPATADELARATGLGTHTQRLIDALVFTGWLVEDGKGGHTPRVR